MINDLTAFFISYKSGIKNFMKWFIIICWSNLYYFNVLYVNIKSRIWVSCKMV